MTRLRWAALGDVMAGDIRRVSGRRGTENGLIEIPL